MLVHTKINSSFQTSHFKTFILEFTVDMCIIQLQQLNWKGREKTKLFGDEQKGGGGGQWQSMTTKDMNGDFDVYFINNYYK